MNYLYIKIKNPLLKFKQFKSYAEKEVMKLNLNVYSNENFFKNIYYPWKKSNLLFKWYSIFENNRTKINKLYLREVYICIQIPLIN